MNRIYKIKHDFIYKGEKFISLGRNSIIVNNKYLEIVMYNDNYKCLFVIEEKIFKLYYNINPYKYNENIYHITLSQFNEVNWKIITPYRNSDDLFFEELKQEEMFIHKDKTFYLKDNIIFPIFRFYSDSRISEYNQYPHLHTSLRCQSMPSNFLYNFRLKFTNTRSHIIQDSTTKKKVNYKLNFCKSCEENIDCHKILSSKISYDLSEISN